MIKKNFSENKSLLTRSYIFYWSILLFIPLLICFGNRSFISFDEGYYILQAKWILQNNDWISPMWWGQVILDRTIGIQYLIALSQKLFGNNSLAIYLPNIFAGSIMLFLTYLLHKEIIRKNYALISTLILSTTFLWINYFHMATQDIFFSSIITFGLFSSIKSYKSKKPIYYFYSGLWIGLAFMLKTYLVFVPFIALIPFLKNQKILSHKLFWIGLFIGFIPFIIWSGSIIITYDMNTYGGLFSKFLNLSKKNTFTNPFFYYLWNFPLNTFPWSLFSIIGFLNVHRLKDKISTYFLFLYPAIVITLLSFFSTKTPYYPIQILPLFSINAFLGIKYIIHDKEKIAQFLNKIIFIFIPIIFSSIGIFINQNYLKYGIDSYTRYTILFCIFSLSLSLFCSIYTDSKKKKLFLIILGPYLISSILVQSGFITDRSKAIRIVTQKIVNNENLQDKKIEIFTNKSWDENATSKIIKISLFMPIIGNGIREFEELHKKEYAWKNFSEENIINKDDYEIISEDPILSPWKLILKK